MMIARFLYGSETLASDHRSGLFCFGSVICFLLTGRSAAFALLAGLFFIETDVGTIRIETNEDVAVPIRIRQGKELVERLTVTSDGATAHVRAGTYTIEIEGDNRSFEVKHNRAVVKAGDVWIARIELMPTGNRARQQRSEAHGSRRNRQRHLPSFHL